MTRGIRVTRDNCGDACGSCAAFYEYRPRFFQQPGDDRSIIVSRSTSKLFVKRKMVKRRERVLRISRFQIYTSEFFILFFSQFPYAIWFGFNIKFSRVLIIENSFVWQSAVRRRSTSVRIGTIAVPVQMAALRVPTNVEQSRLRHLTFFLHRSCYPRPPFMDRIMIPSVAGTMFEARRKKKVGPPRVVKYTRVKDVSACHSSKPLCDRCLVA